MDLDTTSSLEDLSSTTTTLVLPASIAPSDVLSSLIGSSMPNTLVTDTDSPTAPFTTKWVVTSTTTTTTDAAESMGTGTMRVSMSTSTTTSTTTAPLGSATTAIIGAGQIQSGASPRFRWGKISVGILGLCVVAGIAAQM